MPKGSSDLDQIRAALEVVQAGLAPRPNVLAGCFPEARALIDDPSPLKFVLATRRGAKSYSAFLEIVNDALDHPGCSYLVVGLSRLSIKRIFWSDIAKRIDREFQLGCTFHETELTQTFPNGARVFFLGMDAPDQHAKVLGIKLRRCLVDEAQEISGLEELVFRVIVPALIDQSGAITLGGTPGNLVNGFFLGKVAKGCSASHLSPPLMRAPGWSGHCWETTANVCVEPITGKRVCDSFRERIAQLIADDPLVEQTTWFRQMYKGEIVVDDSSRVYKYNPEINTALVLPTFAGGRWHYAMGLDLGYSPDPNAFVVGAWHDWDPTLYLVESFKAWEMDITATAEMVKEYQRRYDLDVVVVDGANKVAVAEMNARHGLTLLPAKKQAKEDAIRLMNDSFIMGRIKLLPDCNKGVPRPHREGQRGVKLGGSLALADEYLNLVWDEKKLGPPTFKHIEHSGCENHGADAALYLWRFATEYLAARPAPGTAVGSDGWFREREEQLWEAEMEIARSRLPAPEPLESSDEWETWARKLN